AGTPRAVLNCCEQRPVKRNGRVEQVSAVPTSPAPSPTTEHFAQGSRVRACPACSRSTEHRLRFRNNGCDVLQCLSCGIGRTETPGSDAAAYYTAASFPGGRADGYSDYLGAEPVLRREFAHGLEFIRKYRADGKLLELGCAYGFLLQEAKRHFE